MTNNSNALLSQCKAGFGYMVYDIAKGVAKTECVDALLLNYRYESFSENRINFIGNKPLLFVKNLLHCSNIAIPIRLWLKYRMSFRSFVRLIYCWIVSGYYYHIIRDGEYDIVHIHGCEFYVDIYLDICKRLNQKYVITLHGLNSFSDIIDLEQAGKKYERCFLKRVTEEGIPITVISTGIKKTILKEYGIENCSNISVICNSFSINSDANIETKCNIREKYSIPNEAKIILYAGNVSRNKNQEQLIRAFGLLPENLRNNTYVLFCGRNIESGYALDGIIEQSGFQKNLIQCGNIDRELMPFYFQQADAVILLSKKEGFGLSLIEGMHFGLPCMTFTDLDAYEDIYNECSVVGLENRRDETVAAGIERLINNRWDKDAIIIYSLKFENETMINNYINKYREIIYG